jgi:hypothetical protein
MIPTPKQVESKDWGGANEKKNRRDVPQKRESRELVNMEFFDVPSAKML